MPFVVSKAPARIESVATSNKRARKSEGEGAKPNHDKAIAIRVDLSHERYTAALESLLPGADRFAKEMSGEDVSYTQTVTNRKKLGRVTATIYDGEGHSVVLKLETATVVGQNAITFGSRGHSRWMPIRLVGAVGRDALPKLDDYLDADVLVDIAVQQLDLEEGLREQNKAKGKGKRGGTHPVDMDGAPAGLPFGEQ
jgi:hypothetical protein